MTISKIFTFHVNFYYPYMLYSLLPKILLSFRKTSFSGSNEKVNPSVITSGTAHEFARSALKLVVLDSHRTYHI